MKYNNNDIGGKVIRSSGVYTVIDNKELNGLVLSQTILHVSQSTNGHYHNGQEEIYFFVYGKGKIFVAQNEYDVSGGDIVLIPDGLFHKVVNTGCSDLIFNCVFNGERT
jgi:oxalate decarboxylase/phosphoglucose isomerase-like protein (cupin superfamily)